MENNTVSTESSFSRKISSRFWNLPHKAHEETKREITFIDDIIQKSHIERTLLENLSGIRTAFDGGAGYGRFSLLLAKHGVHVTHFDISHPMIERARQLAEEQKVSDKITFIHGALEDLHMFNDRQFDLVMSFDAPISYTYPNHENVIKNLVRIGSKKICISVYSRLAWTYQFDPAQKAKYILDEHSEDPLVRWTIDHGLPQLHSHCPNMKNVKEFFANGLMEPIDDIKSDFEKGGTPWPVSYAFMPDELYSLLEKNDAHNIKLAGPGALSRSIPGEVLKNIMGDCKLRLEFLDFSYWYDSQLWCAGMGKDNLLALARL